MQTDTRDVVFGDPSSMPKKSHLVEGPSMWFFLKEMDELISKGLQEVIA